VIKSNFLYNEQNQLSIHNLLFELIDKDFPTQNKKVMESEGCEMDYGFMGFVDQYYHLSKIIPKEYKILDLGSYASAQGYFFRNHKEYIGVDDYEGVRYEFENTKNIIADIKNIVKDWTDTKKIFVICNYVPINLEVSKLMRVKFANIFNFYPD